MNEQAADPGDAAQGKSKKSNQKRSERKRRGRAKKLEAAKQGDEASQIHSGPPEPAHMDPATPNTLGQQHAASVAPYQHAGGQVLGYQALMSSGSGLLGMGSSPALARASRKNKVSRVQQQSRQFHPNPTSHPTTVGQPVNQKSNNLNDDFDKLNLSNSDPRLLASESRPPPRERSRMAYLTEDEPNRLKLSKKWVPENPADAKGYRNGWTQRDHTMEQILLPPPVPTEEYLQVARTLTTLVRNPTERKLLVILDLNGTLLCRARMLNGCRDKYNPWPRTNLPPFLDYIFREHYVVVFSSAMQGTILNLLKATIPREHRSKILRIFTREDMDIPQKYFKLKVSTFKRLSMVWDALGDYGSDLKFDQTNTILMDDSTEKASSEPYNHLLVPEYTVDIHSSGGDGVLGNIAGYLEEARKWENVSSYIRENPFSKERDYPKPQGWVPSMDVYTPGLTFRQNHGYVPQEQFPNADS
ncbi:hypothetical protein TWF281_006005 [Arthrobotrys megalospora]